MIATVIPAWNEPADRIARTVATALAVSDLVVIADDGSRSPITCEGAVVVRQPNRGPAAAMNLGAREALRLGATKIARLDVGDVFRVDEKRRQLASADAASFSPHFDLVESKTFTPPAVWTNRIYTDGAFCICTCVVTVDAWLAVGGFDESLRYGDDWDWAMRVQSVVGWTQYAEITCDAGAFEGGHTKGAEGEPVRRQRKHADLVRVIERGRAIKRR